MSILRIQNINKATGGSGKEGRGGSITGVAS